jgi:hypothetical protein
MAIRKKLPNIEGMAASPPVITPPSMKAAPGRANVIGMTVGGRKVVAPPARPTAPAPNSIGIHLMPPESSWIDRGKLTGRANALTRGKGKKLGLKRITGTTAKFRKAFGAVGGRKIKPPKPKA